MVGQSVVRLRFEHTLIAGDRQLVIAGEQVSVGGHGHRLEPPGRDLLGLTGVHEGFIEPFQIDEKLREPAEGRDVLRTQLHGLAKLRFGGDVIPIHEVTGKGHHPPGGTVRGIELLSPLRLLLGLLHDLPRGNFAKPRKCDMCGGQPAPGWRKRRIDANRLLKIPDSCLYLDAAGIAAKVAPAGQADRLRTRARRGRLAPPVHQREPGDGRDQTDHNRGGDPSPDAAPGQRRPPVH